MWLLAAVISVGAGAGVWTRPGITAVLALGVLAVPTTLARGRLIWWDIVWITLGLLTILGYGFANVGLPGNLPVPFADAILAIVLLRYSMTRRQRLPILPAFLTSALLLLAVIRLSVDYPRWGSAAVRDFSLYPEVFFLAIGFYAMHEFGLRRWRRALTIIFYGQLAYFILYPARHFLADVSPTVGLQKSVPLLGDYAGYSPAVVSGFLFFALVRPVRYSSWLAAACLVPVAVMQERGLYIATAAAVLLVLVTASGGMRLLRGRIALALACGLIALAAVGSLGVSGRLGKVSPSFALAQLATLTGQSGPGSGSAAMRLDWFHATMQRVDSTPNGLIYGVGLGPDLAFGFQGGAVRKPHDDFLEMLARIGVVGLGIFACLMTICVARMARSARSARPEIAAFLLWATGTTVAYLIVAATQPLLAYPYGTMPLFLACGAGLALSYKGRGSTTEASEHLGRLQGGSPPVKVCFHDYQAPNVRPMLSWQFRRRPRVAIARRGLSWGIVDQAFSSLTNLALGVLAARALDVGAFGAFGVVFATYAISLGVCRGVASEPLVVRHSGASQNVWRSVTSEATGVALMIGLALGFIYGATGFVIGGDVGRGLVALGIGMPGLLLQDTWRFSFFAAGRGLLAVLNDALWSVVLFLTAGLLLLEHDISLAYFILAWALGASVAGVAGVAQARTVPRPSLSRKWWREHRELGGRYVAEFMTVSGVSQASLYGVAAIVGVAAIGSFRGAQILFGPVNILFMGITLSAIPEGVRLARSAGARLRRLAITIGAGLAFASVFWSVVAFLTPSAIGSGILGASWPGVHGIVLPLGLAMAGSGAGAGGLIALRALSAARRSLTARMVASPAIVAGALVGALIDGAPGAALGMAVGTWSGAAVWWWQAREGLADHAGLDQTRAVSAT